MSLPLLANKRNRESPAHVRTLQIDKEKKIDKGRERKEFLHDHERPKPRRGKIAKKEDKEKEEE